MKNQPDAHEQLVAAIQESVRDFSQSYKARFGYLQTRITDLLTSIGQHIQEVSSEPLEQKITAEVTGEMQRLRSSWENQVRWQAAAADGCLSPTRFTSQREILGALLDAAAQVSDRCLLLIAKKGTAAGWDGRGFEGEFIERHLQNFSVALSEDGILRRFVDECPPFLQSRDTLPHDQPCLEIAGFEKPARMILAPLCLFDSVTAILYLDGDYLRVEEPQAMRTVHSLLSTTALWLENITMRRSLGLPVTPCPAMAEEIGEAPAEVLAERAAALIPAPAGEAAAEAIEAETPAESQELVSAMMREALGLAERPVEPEPVPAPAEAVEEAAAEESVEEAIEEVFEEVAEEAAEEVAEEVAEGAPEEAAEWPVPPVEAFAPVEEFAPVEMAPVQEEEAAAAPAPSLLDEETLAEEPASLLEQVFEPAADVPADEVEAEPEAIEEPRWESPVDLAPVFEDEAKAEGTSDSVLEALEEEKSTGESVYESLMNPVEEESVEAAAAEEMPVDEIIIEEIQAEEAAPEAVAQVDEIIIEEEASTDELKVDTEELAPEPILFEEEEEAEAPVSFEEEIVLEEKPMDELILEEMPALEEPAPPPRIVEPPAPPPAVPGALWTTPEQEKLHNDAKRFARLLVSEIKLYNEDAVTEGRIERDLYKRLRRDIDRSREMYDKRVPKEVAVRMDYFHEELVRILGANDIVKLGPDYPGPQLISG